MVSVDDYSIYVSQIRYMLKELEDLFLHAEVNPDNYTEALGVIAPMQKNIDRLELIARRKQQVM